MLQFSDLTIETAVANQSEAMETRDHFKNGASSKSQMSRRNFHLFFTVLVAIMFSMVACGGGSGSGSGSKGGTILKGTYVISEQGVEASYIFSGNNFEMVYNGEKIGSGTYELVEDYKEKDFSRGTIFMKTREHETDMKYVLEGNKLTLDGAVLTKK